MALAQLLLCLFLALTSSLAGRVHCQEADAKSTEQNDTTSTPKETTAETILSGEPTAEESSGSAMAVIPDDNEAELMPTEGLSPVIIILPLVAVLVIIGIVVMGVMICRWLRSNSASSDPVQQDAYLEAGEEEKVPMPMFEDDVPSVLELEMEDLEKWMVKDGGGNKLNPGPV